MIWLMFPHSFYVSTQHYHLPLCRTKLIKMSSSFQGPQIWNELVLNIDVDCAVSIFKNRLKRTLLLTGVRIHNDLHLM